MQKPKTREMAQLAILIALMVILTFTPLGFLKVGVISITFLVLPVAIGATVLGPIGGAILGGVFGILSFVQCFAGDPFGAFMLGLNPVLTFLICMIPRILCGWLPGMLFRALYQRDKTKVVSFFAATLSTALLNTIFFMGSIVLFFWQSDAFLGKMGEWGYATDSVWAFLVAVVGVNGVVEAVVNCLLGGTIGKALMKLVNKQ